MIVTTSDGKPAYVRFRGRTTQPDFRNSKIKEVREAAEERHRKAQKRNGRIFRKVVDLFRKNNIIYMKGRH